MATTNYALVENLEDNEWEDFSKQIQDNGRGDILCLYSLKRDLKYVVSQSFHYNLFVCFNIFG